MKKVIVAIAVMLSGCSTLHFTNGPQVQVEETVVREQWHHLTLNDLVEVSPPMDINYNCANQQWDTITIERSFLNGLIAALANPTGSVSIYSPWTIRYRCRESIDQ